MLDAGHQGFSSAMCCETVREPRHGDRGFRVQQFMVDTCFKTLSLRKGSNCCFVCSFVEPGVL